MTPAINYRRLPGRAGLFVRHSLWMKPDHLLRVKAHPYSEEYRRYYFRDIQALVLTERSNPLALIGYIAGVSLLALTGGLLYTRHPVWATFAGLTTLLILLWSWRRPNCVCYLQTRVSTERLYALGRLRAANKTLAILKTEIENVQGAVSSEITEAQHFQVSIPAGPDPNIRHYTGKVHWAVFTLAVARAGSGALEMVAGPYVLWSTVTTLLGLTVILAAIVTAFQQHRTDLSQAVRWLVYTVLAWYPLAGLTAFVSQMYAVIALGPKGSNALAIANHPLVRPYRIVSLVGYLVLGCVGLILSWRHQRLTETPPQLL